MYMDEIVLTAHFRHSGEQAEVSVADLTAAITDVIDHYDTPALLGEAFCRCIGSGDGPDKFARLLAAAGFSDDPAGFCRQLVALLETAGGRDGRPVRINDVQLPHLVVVAVLEKLIPGDRFTSVRSVERLETLANIRVPAEQRDGLERVLSTYPVRLSSHTLRQMRSSAAVAYQYLPFVEELDPVGHVNTWIGQFHDGLLERMYQNRVIFLLNMTCPVYCRFCFRKHKASRNQPNFTRADLERAVNYVRQSPSIKEIVITGGDPLMNRSNLAVALDGLMDIPHVQTLRVATRSIAYYPNLFYAKNGSLLKYLKAKGLELQIHGKRLEIATHFIHPDEVSPESLDLISDFAKNGVAVYVQTPFLKGCNDEGPELVRLFHLLRGAGAELHYIYIPCSAIQGNSIYWTPISKGIAAAHYLRAHLSDRVIPRICTATPIGKMEWNTSGWAVAPDAENPLFTWLRTPYSPDYFKDFAPLTQGLDNLRVNVEGTIDVRFMATMGDDALVMGPRKPVAEPLLETDLWLLDRLRSRSLGRQSGTPSVVDTQCEGLSRVHETRVEVDLRRFGGDTGYIKDNPAVTDAVLWAENDAVEHLSAVERFVNALAGLSHVNAVRLRCLTFLGTPARFTRTVIDRLAALNRLTVARPLRLEIETQFMHPSEVLPAHAVLAGELRNKGITVYANVPLLAGVNDAPDPMSRLAYALRQAGIEFHHVYVAGLPIQQAHGDAHPVQVSHVIDVAGRVRRDGSGREIPGYIIRTELGEVDFGLTSRLIRDNGGLRVRLNPYDLAYFRRMDPGFQWPEGVVTDGAGKPLVPVRGLADTEGFMVFDA